MTEKRETGGKKCRNNNYASPKNQEASKTIAACSLSEASAIFLKIVAFYLTYEHCMADAIIRNVLTYTVFTLEQYITSSTVRCGPVRYGTVRSSAVWYGAVQYGTVRSSAVWYGAVQCGMVRCGPVRYGAVQCGMVRCGPVRYGTVRSSAVWYGAVWCVPVYTVPRNSVFRQIKGVERR